MRAKKANSSMAPDYTPDEKPSHVAAARKPGGKDAPAVADGRENQAAAIDAREDKLRKVGDILLKGLFKS
ncbi:MAG: hypothetical protein FWG72_01515 [Oscillospiraceae bacterium]|nr:hypothetical protein [Oscillospiraceae bacterium]